AGYSPPLPLSPADAVNVTLEAMKCESYDGSLENSLPPQLMDTTEAPWYTEMSTAFNRSEKLLEAASTSRILAAGAIAWAHSTSNAISSAQPALVRGLNPAAYTLRKHPLRVVHDGSPNVLLNTARSDSIFGSS